jgi:hypothetical protein
VAATSELHAAPTTVEWNATLATWRLNSQAPILRQLFRSDAEPLALQNNCALDSAEALRARCRAYCRFAIDHPRVYQLMFQDDLPLTLHTAPEATPDSFLWRGESSTDGGRSWFIDELLARRCGAT